MGNCVSARDAAEGHTGYAGSSSGWGSLAWGSSRGKPPPPRQDDIVSVTAGRLFEGLNLPHVEATVASQRTDDMLPHGWLGKDAGLGTPGRGRSKSSAGAGGGNGASKLPSSTSSTSLLPSHSSSSPSTARADQASLMSNKSSTPQIMTPLDTLHERSNELLPCIDLTPTPAGTLPEVPPDMLPQHDAPHQHHAPHPAAAAPTHGHLQEPAHDNTGILLGEPAPQPPPSMPCSSSDRVPPPASSSTVCSLLHGMLHLSRPQRSVRFHDEGSCHSREHSQHGAGSPSAAQCGGSQCGWQGTAAADAAADLQGDEHGPEHSHSCSSTPSRSTSRGRTATSRALTKTSSQASLLGICARSRSMLASALAPGGGSSASVSGTQPTMHKSSSGLFRPSETGTSTAAGGADSARSSAHSGVHSMSRPGMSRQASALTCASSGKRSLLGGSGMSAAQSQRGSSAHASTGTHTVVGSPECMGYTLGVTNLSSFGSIRGEGTLADDAAAVPQFGPPCRHGSLPGTADMLHGRTTSEGGQPPRPSYEQPPTIVPTSSPIVSPFLEAATAPVLGAAAAAAKPHEHRWHTHSHCSLPQATRSSSNSLLAPTHAGVISRPGTPPLINNPHYGAPSCPGTPPLTVHASTQPLAQQQQLQPLIRSSGGGSSPLSSAPSTSSNVASCARQRRASQVAFSSEFRTMRKHHGRAPSVLFSKDDVQVTGLPPSLLSAKRRKWSNASLPSSAYAAHPLSASPDPMQVHSRGSLETTQSMQGGTQLSNAASLHESLGSPAFKQGACGSNRSTGSAGRDTGALTHTLGQPYNQSPQPPPYPQWNHPQLQQHVTVDHSQQPSQQCASDAAPPQPGSSTASERRTAQDALCLTPTMPASEPSGAGSTRATAEADAVTPQQATTPHATNSTPPPPPHLSPIPAPPQPTSTSTSTSNNTVAHPTPMHPTNLPYLIAHHAPPTAQLQHAPSISSAGSPLSSRPASPGPLLTHPHSQPIMPHSQPGMPLTHPGMPFHSQPGMAANAQPVQQHAHRQESPFQLMAERTSLNFPAAMDSRRPSAVPGSPASPRHMRGAAAENEAAYTQGLPPERDEREGRVRAEEALRTACRRMLSGNAQQKAPPQWPIGRARTNSSQANSQLSTLPPSNVITMSDYSCHSTQLPSGSSGMGSSGHTSLDPHMFSLQTPNARPATHSQVQLPTEQQQDFGAAWKGALGFAVDSPPLVRSEQQGRGPCRHLPPRCFSDGSLGLRTSRGSGSTFHQQPATPEHDLPQWVDKGAGDIIEQLQDSDTRAPTIPGGRPPSGSAAWGLNSMPDLLDEAYKSNVCGSSMGADFAFDDEDDSGKGRLSGSNGSDEEDGGEVEFKYDMSGASRPEVVMPARFRASTEQRQNLPHARNPRKSLTLNLSQQLTKSMGSRSGKKW